MTNEEKALSIARLKKISESDKYENPFKLEIYERCLEMAQWKQQQMIEKSVEWLNAHLPFGEVDFNLRNTIIEDFKQSMEEK